jgi:hypothetical protein
MSKDTEESVFINMQFLAEANFKYIQEETVLQ